MSPINDPTAAPLGRQILAFTGAVEVNARDGHLFVQAGDPVLLSGVEAAVDPAASTRRTGPGSAPS